MGNFALTVALHVEDNKHVGIAWKRINGRKENNVTGEKRLEDPLPKKLTEDIARVEAVRTALNQFESSKIVLRLTDRDLADIIRDPQIVDIFRDIRRLGDNKKASKVLQETYTGLFKAIAKHKSVSVELISKEDPIFEKLKQNAEGVSAKKKKKPGKPLKTHRDSCGSRGLKHLDF